MITYGQLGKPGHGRLGNQLFQIASTIGMALSADHDFAFPEWSYSKYFANKLPTAGVVDAWEVPEESFTYIMPEFHPGENYSIQGWRQSEKYFAHERDFIESQFLFETDFLIDVMKRNELAFSKPNIAISVRRGDFVGNSNYAQIPVRYYVLGLLEGIPDWQKYNILFFSDDMAYCRVQFEGCPNAFFCEGSDIEQLCMMTRCMHFVISNSTFSWWGAWLGQKDGSIVIRPPKNFDGELARKNPEWDYWPENWKMMDYFHSKIDLTDVVFTIPVFIDHNHRLQNLKLSVDVINESFYTSIIVMEQGGNKAADIKGAKYVQAKGMRDFHRTKMLNDMAKMGTEWWPIVVNWDADVFVPVLQIWLAADAIRKGADMVYPYDGRFARVPREWYNRLNEAKDVGIFGDTQFTGKHGKPVPVTSVGGAIMFNRESFLNCGGENEFMISFGPEDWERYYRFEKLGYTIQRIHGSLYHLDHWCGPNSSTWNPHFKNNHAELDELRKLSQEDLENYVGGWPWRQ